MNNEECIELMLFEWFILFNFIDSLVRKRREMFICLVKIAFCAETISQKYNYEQICDLSAWLETPQVEY